WSLDRCWRTLPFTSCGSAFSSCSSSGRSLTSCRMSTKPAPQIGSILGYSNQEIIGDGVWKLPFLATLRAAWPDATITWATAKDPVYTRGLKPLADALGIEPLPNCDAQLRWPAVALRRPFGGRRFDLIIDTQSHVARTMALRRTKHGRFISPSADF